MLTRGKSIAKLGFLLSAAVVVAGCAGADGNGTSSPSAGGGTADSDATPSGTLTISSVTVGQEAVEWAIEKFEAMYPDVVVQVDFAGTEQYQSVLRTQLTSGTGPDIMFVQPGDGTPSAMRSLAPPGFLADLSDMDFSSQVPASMDLVTAIDGARYFIPMSVSGIGVVYNETAFNELGLEVPNTWSGVLQFCADAQAAGKIPFALGAQTLWVTQLPNYALASTLVFGSAEADFDAQMAAGTTSFEESPGWNLTFEKYMEMVDASCFNDDVLGTAFETTIGQVASGEALSTIQVTAVAPAIAGAAPEGTVISMYPLPATDNPAETWMPAAVGAGFGINADAQNPVAARAFIDLLTDPEVLAEYATQTGAFPAIPTDAFEQPESLAFMADLIAQDKVYPFMDQLWPNARVQPAQYDGIQALLAGIGTISDLLAAMDAAYRS